MPMCMLFTLCGILFQLKHHSGERPGIWVLEDCTRSEKQLATKHNGELMWLVCFLYRFFNCAIICTVRDRNKLTCYRHTHSCASTCITTIQFITYMPVCACTYTHTPVDSVQLKVSITIINIVAHHNVIILCTYVCICIIVNVIAFRLHPR